VRGIARLAARGRGSARGSAPKRDGTPLRRGVALVQEPLDRHGHEVGIAQIARAVAIGAAQRLDDEMRARRRVLGVEIESFQDVQRLDEHDAPRGRGRCRDDPNPAIVPDDGRPFDDPIALEVL